ncbi:hypothetical protein D3C85_1093900 [compost metagenome]
MLGQQHDLLRRSVAIGSRHGASEVQGDRGGAVRRRSTQITIFGLGREERHAVLRFGRSAACQYIRLDADVQ